MANIIGSLRWIVLRSSLATFAVFVVCAPSVHALSLPDGREYELVSPAYKHGGIGGVFPLGSLTSSIEETGWPLQSSTDGRAVTYLGEDFYEPRLGSLNQYISSLGAEGWSTNNVTLGVPSPNESAIEANLDVGFSPDLSKAVFSSMVPLASSAPHGFANLYAAQDSNIQPLLTNEPPNRTTSTFGHAWFERGEVQRKLLFSGGNVGDGGVASFSHILFEANDALTPNAQDEGELANNLYEWVGGSLRLVNILPDGSTHANASFGVDNRDFYISEPFPNLSHVISADGARIFWTDETTRNLYLREDGERTVQVDGSVGGGGKFQTANLDGSKVFFTKGGKLYRFEVAGQKATELVGNGVEGLVGTSADGTYVYLVTTSVFGEGAVEGKPNLYLAHEGGLTFIATLSPADNEIPELYGSATPYGDWYRTFAGRTAEVSPDGRYVAFMSKMQLTDYNNVEVGGTRHVYEIFLYDAATHKLTCASCNQDGSRPMTDVELPPPINGTYQQRYLTDGGRLFFSTANAVLPQDTNGKLDLYEYEDGEVNLISPGNFNTEAVFADASESGNDLFFTTAQQLVPADHDEITDLYDARVGGRQEESRPAPGCSGEACRELPVPPPSAEEPLTSVFTGPGNLVSSLPGKGSKKTAIVKKPSKKRVRRRRRHPARRQGRSITRGKG